MPIHQAAAQGFSSAVDAYERARPGYPPEAVGALLTALRVGPGDLLLEVGAGTGKLTRLAAAQGARVLAVEPVAGMRRKLVGAPGVLVAGGIAEALPLRDGAVRAVAVATAFHWFDGPVTLRELHRVLAPGGRLALLWNRRDDTVPWIARLSAILDAAERPGVPRYRTGRWRDAFVAAPGLFGPLQEARFRHVHRLPPEGVVERVASVSYVAALPAEQRRPILDAVRALLASQPETAGERELALAYVTDLFWCERR